MHKLVSTILAVSLVATSAAWAGETLSPGKPAGVHKAQGGFGTTEMLVFGGIAGLAIGIGVATSGGRSSPADNSISAVASATSAT